MQKFLVGAGVGIKAFIVSALVIGAVHHYGGNKGSSYVEANNTGQLEGPQVTPPTNTSDYATQRTTPNLDR